MPSPKERPHDHPQGRFTGRRLIVGITGGIAAYKIAHVVSHLAQDGAEVTVAMSPAATRFVTPMTFEALSGRAVLTCPFTPTHAHDPQHVGLARDAEAMIIAPCTMDTLSRLATGRADDVICLLAAALDRTRQPLLLAPSMNEAMYLQPATQRNLATVQADGCRIIEPASGWQACRTEGVGRLPEPPVLLDALFEALGDRAN